MPTTPKLRSTSAVREAAGRAKEHLTLSPQNRLILDFLRSGRTVTNLIAITTMGVGSLTKRISELKELGYKILSEVRTDHRGKDYKAYWLHVGEHAKAVVG